MKVKALQELECQGVLYQEGDVFEATKEDMDHMGAYVEVLKSDSETPTPDEENRPKRKAKRG